MSQSVQQEICKQKAVNFKRKLNGTKNILFFRRLKSTQTIKLSNRNAYLWKFQQPIFSLSTEFHCVSLSFTQSNRWTWVVHATVCFPECKLFTRRKNPLNREALNIFIFCSNWNRFFLHCLGYSSELFSLSWENNTEISVFTVKWKQVCWRHFIYTRPCVYRVMDACSR